MEAEMRKREALKLMGLFSEKRQICLGTLLQMSPDLRTPSSRKNWIGGE